MAAEGRVEPTIPVPVPTPAADGWAWLKLFRTFQVALDPRKLFVAALGILVMSLGWYVLSCMFHYKKPIKGNEELYGNKVVEKSMAKPPAEMNPADWEKKVSDEAVRRFQRDIAQWKVIDELAGPGGKLRTMPWDEARGPNPYLFASSLASKPPGVLGEEIVRYLSGQIPVLIEPLMKLLIPVIKIVDPNASFMTRFYLLLCLAWSVAVWAFFGGIITRLAAVQLASTERITLKQAVMFVVRRYTSYVLSPIVPLGVVAVIVLVMFVYGLVALIPWVGDLVLYGLLFPLIILGGIAMAIVLLGLVGYPLMYTTISTEGSDTFDAISRSYNYVFQAPWSFLWYSFISILYGAVVTFAVIVVACSMVLLGKWAMGSAASLTGAEWRKPEYLFVYAPESLGWKQLLLSGSDVAIKPKQVLDAKTGQMIDDYRDYEPVSPALSEAYLADMRSNHAGAGIVWFWMVLVFLLMIGFSYSYFWTASTMIYLLMRKKVDEVEIDEVYIEQPLPAPPTPGLPPVPPTPMPTTAPVVPPPPAGPSLPMVPA